VTCERFQSGRDVMSSADEDSKIVKIPADVAEAWAAVILDLADRERGCRTNDVDERNASKDSAKRPTARRKPDGKVPLK